MITLNNWATQAHQKLDSEKGSVQGRKETVMAGAVLAAIKDFCTQDEEFAQAVVQGESFAKCMSAVARAAGMAMSDLDAYKKAVEFYFPGAKVQMQLTIDLIGDAAQEAPVGGSPKTGLILKLEDFLG